MESMPDFVHLRGGIGGFCLYYAESMGIWLSIQGFIATMNSLRTDMIRPRLYEP